MLEDMLFDSWEGLFRTAIVGVSAYVALVFLLRVSGKRTLARMNAFDLVVTVALGSTLATILLSKQTALAEGVMAFALLIILQYLISWLSVRSVRFRRIVRSEPRLLFFNGRFLRAALQVERVSESELVQAVRSQGVGQMDSVTAVVLETDGTFSVISNSEEVFTALDDVPCGGDYRKSRD